ncbi:MAG: thioredoxin family protein [Candidatus Izemoplasmatales bacterium]
MKCYLISAKWCPACLIMIQRYRAFFAQQIDVDITIIDYDEEPERVKEFAIGSTLPVLVVYINHQETKRIIGEKSLKELQRIFSV